jgi:hypothetical protein
MDDARALELNALKGLRYGETSPKYIVYAEGRLVAEFDLPFERALAIYCEGFEIEPAEFRVRIEPSGTMCVLVIPKSE